MWQNRHNNVMFTVEILHTRLFGDLAYSIFIRISLSGSELPHSSKNRACVGHPAGARSELQPRLKGDHAWTAIATQTDAQ